MSDPKERFQKKQNQAATERKAQTGISAKDPGRKGDSV